MYGEERNKKVFKKMKEMSKIKYQEKGRKNEQLWRKRKN